MLGGIVANAWGMKEINTSYWYIKAKGISVDPEYTVNTGKHEQVDQGSYKMRKLPKYNSSNKIIGQYLCITVPNNEIGSLNKKELFLLILYQIPLPYK